MRGVACALGLALLALAACTDPPEAGTPTDDPGRATAPTLHTYYLKPAHVLATDPPASAGPQRVDSVPYQNAFVNEDLEIFTSVPSPGLHVTTARLVVHYAVDHATADPHRDDANPPRTRHFVFWAGSGGVYPILTTVFGDPVLLAGRVYAADVTFGLPPGGWVVPRGEAVQVMVAPLVLNERPSNLHYLVDHATTPSRLELEAAPWPDPAPTPTESETRPRTIPLNSGLFTGALAGDSSTLRESVHVPDDASYAKLAVRWKSTVGPKSDLDLVLYDAQGQAAASSTTPYQSETIRLFPPHLAEIGAGPWQVEVNAYSGANTEFDLLVEWAKPG